MWLKWLVDQTVQKRCRFCLSFGLLISLFQACASSHVQAQKTPGADLWMYHTYAWRAQGSTADQADAASKAKERTDFDLAKKGMIPVPYTGNPDVWILQDTTPYSISLEFRDAHTGATYWKGQSHLSSAGEPPSQNKIHSAVDALIDRYISDQEWKNGSWWFGSGIQHG